MANSLIDRKTRDGRLVLREHVVCVKGAAPFGDKLVGPADLEASFQHRLDAKRLRGAIAPLLPLKLLSWSRGFDCHVAYLELDGVMFRYVRTGITSGWFDLGSETGGGRR